MHERKLSRQERRAMERAENKTRRWNEREHPLSPHDMIDQGADSLHISPSLTEQQLWKGYADIPPIHPIGRGENPGEKAVRRLHKTLDLIDQSENPILQETSAIINSPDHQESLQIRLEQDVFVNGRPALVATQLAEENGQPLWQVVASASQIVGSNEFYLAISYAHEIQHVKDFMQYQSQLPSSLAVPERIVIHNTRLHNPSSLIKDEARGWGAQALATVHSYGLGVKGALPPQVMEFTAAFVKHDMDIDSPSWREYVAKEIFRLPNFRIK
jgi:hypothetical protein